MIAPGVSESREEDAARTWGMVAHLATLANLAFPLGGLVVAIVIFTASRHGLPVARGNARNALNMQLTLAAFNAVTVGIALGCFAGFFVNEVAGCGNHGCAHPVFPWQMLAYFGCFLTLILVNLIVAICGAFGACAAYLGRVFRYAIAIPFVRVSVLAGP